MCSRQERSSKMVCSGWLLICLLWSLAAAADERGEERRRNACPQRHFGEFSDWSHPVNLGPIVNSAFDDFHPAISPNGLSLYISSMRPGFGGSDIWVSQRRSLRDAWGPPRNLGPKINSEGNDFAPDLTPEGHWMLFSSTRPPGTLGNSQIWASFREDPDDDFGWSAPVNLGSDINGSGLDNNAPTYFRDRSTGVASVYFNSILRRDGPGDFDIYVSTQRRDGSFGPAVLVPELCTPQRDTRTAIRRDGREMFITSARPGGSGGNDLWVSTRETTAHSWSTPVNLGRTINTASDDGGPALSCDGTTLYFTSSRPGGSGVRDLYVATRLIEHVVAPQATDPAIDQALENHYAWLDPAARSNHKLLVFMPGTATPAGSYQLVQREAARLGYHVIGLMYPNSVRLVGACPGTADPNTCFENARLQILDGIDRHTVVDVNRPNSIDNRLTKLLQYLTARYPEEGWSRFLAHGEPKWSRIAVSGHSQGGGQAAMIAKLRVVPRVVLFSAVPDTVAGLGAPTWETGHATASERYWGLVHERDPSFHAMTASWHALGMDAFGRRVRVEESGPPYELTHTLTTDLLPKSGSYTVPPNGSHGSTAWDDSTPIASDGTPLLRDAWRYLLTAEASDDEPEEE